MSKRSFEAITFVYYFLIAQISMDKEQDTKAYTIDFLLTAKERKKKKMCLYNEELCCFHPNRMIADMGQSDDTYHLM